MVTLNQTDQNPICRRFSTSSDIKKKNFYLILSAIIFFGLILFYVTFFYVSKKTIISLIGLRCGVESAIFSYQEIYLLQSNMANLQISLDLNILPTLEDVLFVQKRIVYLQGILDLSVIKNVEELALLQKHIYVLERTLDLSIQKNVEELEILKVTIDSLSTFYHDAQKERLGLLTLSLDERVITAFESLGLKLKTAVLH